MHSSSRFIRWGVLSALILTLPTGLGCNQDQAASASGNSNEAIELVIITPHSQAIREAFTEGFQRWQQMKDFKTPITIRWIAKGTTECQRYIHERFSQYSEGKPQIGVDVFFGGGVAAHQDIARRGYAQPITLPEDVLAGIPKELNGQRLYSPDGAWHGTALGGFGILYNRAACEARGIAPPQTWSDLAAPAYRGWMAAADPNQSGSTTQCLALVLLSQGWEQGFGTAMGVLANCDGLLESSSMIAPNVRSGIALAGLEPEFVARMSMADSAGVLEYVNPPAATAITPDPVTVLTGTQRPAAATQFVRFVLSPEGQALWALPPDADGGPAYEALYRYPIRPDVYEKHAGKMVIQGNPFKEAAGMKVDPVLEEAYVQLLPVLVEAASGANHYLLEKAWTAALAEGADGNTGTDASAAGANSGKLALLKAPPFSKEQAIQFATQLAANTPESQRFQADWSQLFRQRYEQILGIPTTAPTAAVSVQLAGRRMLISQ